MVMFVVKGKYGHYPNIVLNGKNFYLKAQEYIFGKTDFKVHSIARENIKDLKIEILHIDLEKDEINRTMANYFKDNKVVDHFTPLYNSTIDKHYTKIYEEQNFDFYQNLCDNYGVEVLNEIIYMVIFRNVSANWVSVYFDIPLHDIEFMLENLPIYYNFLEEV